MARNSLVPARPNPLTPARFPSGHHRPSTAGEEEEDHRSCPLAPQIKHFGFPKKKNILDSCQMMFMMATLASLKYMLAVHLPVTHTP